MVASRYETEALVLSTTEHGESDQIVTFFTQSSGRVTAIAKGAKKSKKRFVNKLEQFSFLRIVYQQKNNNSLSFLSEAELHTAFIHLRNNVHLYEVASVIREFLLFAIKEGEPEKKVFQLSLWALHSLNQNQTAKSILALYLLRFFDYIGYRPNLECCNRCDSTIHPGQNYRFDSGSGGLICTNCFPGSSRGKPIFHGTIKILKSGQDQPLEKLHRLKLSGQILQESLRLLHNYGSQIFQKDIVSWKSLKNSPNS